MPDSTRIASITTSLAVIFSALIALLPPIGYFTLSYHYLKGTLETEAEINSRLVSGLINANPDLWRYESARIVELLNRRPRAGHAETRRIYDQQGVLVAESVNPLDPPLLKASHEIFDAGKTVGRIEINRSLLPLLYTSGLLALLGLGLGLLAFRIIPFRAVIRAANKLQDANDFLHKVMEGSSNAIVVLDRSGVIRMSNSRLAALCGSPFSTFLGQPLSPLFRADDRQRIEAGIHDLLEGREERFAFDTELPRQDGRLVNLAGGAVALVSEGRISGVVLTLEDNTDRKRVEEVLREKNSELERFSYTVSHDLKSPLITIQTFCGQVLQDFDSGTFTHIRDDLRRISGAASKMMLLLDALLKLSRIGKLMQAPAPVDMKLLVEDVLRQLAGPLALRKVEVVVARELHSVAGDPVRIAEVLQNLLENAIKYMGDQKAPRIEIGTRREGRELVYCIRDNGEGIEPRFHDKIFELFQQVGANCSGTGIGLTLVRRIIDVHGGRIWVESEGAGQGSTFCFTLPESVDPEAP